MLFQLVLWPVGQCRNCLKLRDIAPLHLPVFMLLGGERHCESKVSCSRTPHNAPNRGSNLNCSIWSPAHKPQSQLTFHMTANIAVLKRFGQVSIFLKNIVNLPKWLTWLISLTASSSAFSTSSKNVKILLITKKRSYYVHGTLLHMGKLS